MPRGELSPGILSRKCCLWGGLSPGRGMLSPREDCLWGRLSPGRKVSGAYCLRDILSPGQIFSGHIVSGAYCLWTDFLWAYCLRGTLSAGRIVLRHIVFRHIFMGHHVPPPALIVGRTEKNKISKSTKFRVKFHVSIHRYGVHGLKKVIFVHFGLQFGLRR